MTIEREDDDMESKTSPIWIKRDDNVCIGQQVEVAYHRSRLIDEAAEGRLAAVAREHVAGRRPAWLRRQLDARLVAVAAALGRRPRRSEAPRLAAPRSADRQVGCTTAPRVS